MPTPRSGLLRCDNASLACAYGTSGPHDYVFSPSSGRQRDAHGRLAASRAASPRRLTSLCGDVAEGIGKGIGKGIQTVAMPCVNAAYVKHHQFDRSVAALRSRVVQVLYGEGGFVPNRPGECRTEGYPWHLVLEAAERLRT